MVYKALKGVDTFMEKVSLYALIVSVFGMLLLTLLTIVLRWFSLTYLWMDPLIRHLVFLSTFLGGVVATGSKQHIAIDIFYRMAEQNGKERLTLFFQFLTALVSCITLIWLITGAIQFVNDAFKYEKVVFLGIHRGFLVSIIPFGMGLIAYRFLILSIEALMKLINPEQKV
ncbi:TRAP transporter small permease subunit [Bacteriovoracales bacterium]|nr:TRAP transporter small permease subunit [Bacteriovoracales bacterium]